MLAAACGWDDRQKAIELATSLRDQAVGVLATLAPHQRYDYRSLVAALEARFEPRHQTEMHRAGLRTRLRKRNEPLLALAQDLKKLTWKAFPTANQELCEQMNLNYFIDALNDGEMEWNVYQGKPRSVEQAVSLAMEYESFKAARRGKRMDQLDLRAVTVDDFGRTRDPMLAYNVSTATGLHTRPRIAGNAFGTKRKPRQKYKQRAARTPRLLQSRETASSRNWGSSFG